MTSVDCNPMVALANSKFLKLSLAFNLIITLSAVPVLFWATWKLWSMRYSKLFHINFKIIIQLHLFGFLLHCTGRIILHSMDLINYTFRDNPCDMIPNIYRCFVLRLMYNTGLWITNSTAVSLVIERWLATKKSATYEESSVLLGIFVAVLQFVIAAIPLGVLYSKFQFEGGEPMYYCVTAQASVPWAGQMSAIVGFMFQMCSRLSFHYLYRQNKVRVAVAYTDEKSSIQHNRESNIHHSTLSNRYQLEQNMSSIACLKTFANISTTFIVIYNTCYITLMYVAGSWKEQYLYYGILEINLAFPSYAIISIFVLSGTMKKIRKRIGVVLVSHLNTPHNHYFENFKRQIA